MMNDSGSRQRDRKTNLRQSELRTIRRRVHRRFLMANRVKAIPTTQEQLIQVQFNQGALTPPVVRDRTRTKENQRAERYSPKASRDVDTLPQIGKVLSRHSCKGKIKLKASCVS